MCITRNARDRVSEDPINSVMRAFEAYLADLIQLNESAHMHGLKLLQSRYANRFSCAKPPSTSYWGSWAFKT